MPILYDKTRMGLSFSQPIGTHSVNGSLMVTDSKNSEVVTGRAKQLHAMQHKESHT
jgi:hypothetical protein